MCDCGDYQHRLLKLNDEYKQQGSPIRLHCKHILAAKTMRPETCEWNPETCPGCMLERNCKAHADRVAAAEAKDREYNAMKGMY